MRALRMPSLKIGRLKIRVPIIQGGMGVGISLSRLASAVANEGGVGVIATAGIGRLEPDFHKSIRVADARALRKEIRKARKRTNGIIGVNIMMALTDFDQLLQTSVEEKVDIVFISAGLPLTPPPSLSIDLLEESGTCFVPKVSSSRAVSVIFRQWERRYHRVPDAVVVEGPMAGGHLGFRKNDLDNPDFSLERILPEVISVLRPFASKSGRRIPVIAAGGIFTGEDIHRFLHLGADGVTMGTRFVTTEECDAHMEFKKAFLSCSEKDIGIIDSPLGLPGRAIIGRFLTSVAKGKRKPYRCLWKCLKTCDVRNAPYCIAEALTNAREGNLEEGFAFAGANASRVQCIVTVKNLFRSLIEEYNISASIADPVPHYA